MKKVLLWILFISAVLAFLAGLINLLCYSASAAKHPVLSFVFSFLGTFVLLYVSLSFLLQRQISDLKKLISENPFSELIPFRTRGLNPFNDLKESIKRNNDKSNAELDKLNTLEQYRREYIGNVSHELKTPIFNIQGYILTLLDGGLEDPYINRNFLEKADKNVDRMINIVMDLQTISRFEAGELELQKESFEIYQLLEDVMETEKENAAKSQTRFVLFKGKPILVFGDKFRIRQVLTNLMVNSIRYAKPGGGETNIRVYELSDRVRIEISDNGIGIEEKHLSRIFERFYRVDSSRSREKGGSGLGLAIVKHIIEAHGETIEVMSTAGVGTVFSFSLSKPEKNPA